MEYYMVFTLSAALQDPEENWYSEAQKTWLCTGCRRTKPPLSPVDVVIAGKPYDLPYNYVNGADIGIAKWEFLEALGRDVVEEYLLLGRLFTKEGKELKDFATLTQKRDYFQIIRGTELSTWRACELCGRFLYHNAEKAYLFSGELIEIPLAWGTYLVVDEVIHKCLVQKKWKRVGTKKLPVLDKPLDGYGALRPLMR